MIKIESPFHPLAQLEGARIVVLNWRDIQHPQAGGAEQYMHQIARRWVEVGAQVTWLTSRGPGQTHRGVIDGIEIVRSGGALGIYPRTALALLRRYGRIDYVVDCQNGIPFFSPLFVERDVPVVQVVHHVHQDQFAMRFGPVLSAVGRFLESRGTRAVYKDRPTAAVSPSTRQELRRRLGFRGPIHIVPNGNTATPDVRSPRDPEPTITVVSRLVPHKRVDVLLAQLAVAAAAEPKLRVDIVGDGPERVRLTALAAELGLGDVVTFHGFQPDEIRDELLRRAWLTMSTSHHEGWGLSIIEAAAYGVPTLALRVPGVRDSVVKRQHRLARRRGRPVRHGGDPGAARARRRGPRPRDHRGLPGLGAVLHLGPQREPARGRAARRGQAGDRPGRPLGPQRHGHHRGVRPAA